MRVGIFSTREEAQKRYRPMSWHTIRNEWDGGKGRTPSKGELAGIIFWQAPPRDLLPLVSGLISGSIPYSRGPAPKRDPLEPERAIYWEARVYRLKKKYLNLKRHHPDRWRALKTADGLSKDPYQRALAVVSRRTGITTAQLDRWCYPRGAVWWGSR